MNWKKLPANFRKAFGTVAVAATIAGAFASAPTAQAGVIFDNLNTVLASGATPVVQGPGEGITGLIHVANGNVNINQFSIYGAEFDNGNVKFVIFTQSGTRIYASDAVAVAGTETNQWYDSPIFSPITLQANNAYYFGLVLDHSFTFIGTVHNPYYWQNGLASNYGGVLGDNSNTYFFPDPQTSNQHGWMTLGMRVSLQDTTPTPTPTPAPSPVPEPGTLAIFGLGLVGLGLARRRKKA